MENAISVKKFWIINLVLVTFMFLLYTCCIKEAPENAGIFLVYISVFLTLSIFSTKRNRNYVEIAINFWFFWAISLCIICAVYHRTVFWCAVGICSVVEFAILIDTVIRMIKIRKQLHGGILKRRFCINLNCLKYLVITAALIMLLILTIGNADKNFFDIRPQTLNVITEKI